MHFPSLLAGLAALASSAQAVNHVVSVSGSNGSLTFNPANTVAAMGDTVMFSFWPKNHSVAQAAFASPCQPMANGFWSGYMPVSNNSTGSMQFMMTVNASTPLWFYCTQAMHCQSGMVGSINAPATGNTIAGFMAAAKNAKSNVTPESKAGTGGMIVSGAAGGAGGAGGAGNGTASTGKGGASATASSGGAQASTAAGSTLDAGSGLGYAGALAALGYALL